MPGKRVEFDQESYAALDLLARDRMMTFQELAEEAFRDLLRKHGRPVELKEALRKSARASTAAPKQRKKSGKTSRPKAHKRKR
jgi:hypothetical protein